MYNMLPILCIFEWAFIYNLLQLKTEQKYAFKKKIKHGKIVNLLI